MQAPRVRCVSDTHMSPLAGRQTIPGQIGSSRRPLRTGFDYPPQPVPRSAVPELQRCPCPPVEVDNPYTNSKLELARSTSCRVVLAGLVAREDLNGQHGTVRALNTERGRFRVNVDGEGDLALKPANLRPYLPGRARRASRTIATRTAGNGKAGGATLPWRILRC